MNSLCNSYLSILNSNLLPETVDYTSYSLLWGLSSAVVWLYAGGVWFDYLLDVQNSFPRLGHIWKCQDTCLAVCVLLYLKAMFAVLFSILGHQSVCEQCPKGMGRKFPETLFWQVRQGLFCCFPICKFNCIIYFYIGDKCWSNVQEGGRGWKAGFRFCWLQNPPWIQC